MRSSLSSVDKSNPILSSLGWSAVPKSTISASPMVGETLWSLGLESEVEEESSSKL